jgi:hypothetical protein
MRVLKMYGWEEPFRQLVQRIRSQVGVLENTLLPCM